ncbi:MAG: peptidylprolyl isomerase [Rhodobacteraceae bacterium]|nr:peptidylprolyl isomerase [Paracoccaceae bacterium]
MKKTFAKCRVWALAAPVVCALLYGLVSEHRPAAAQNLFSPAITVNDRAITHYEIDQRVRMLSLLQPLGALEAQAREQLIEERLQLEAAEIAGLEITPAEIAEGIEEFATRFGYTREGLLAFFAAEGVDEGSFTEFVRAGLAWRAVVQALFRNRVGISETEIDRALAASAGGLRVQVAEIMMSLSPGAETETRLLAQQMATITSFDEFSEAARQYSSSPSWSRGGLLDWVSIADLPLQLRPVIVGLAPGQVSAPMMVADGNALALFQMRDIEETSQTAPEYAAIEYALLQTGSKNVQDIANQVDSCDDLYGVAQDLPDDALQRFTLTSADIPADIAQELAQLDQYEIAIHGGESDSPMLLMLCARTARINESLERAEIRTSLSLRRLESFADSYLDQLRSSARIRESDQP